jgi:hypothetical protein
MQGLLDAARDENGSIRTMRRRDHRVAFWASTATGGDIIIRANHPDSDQDGLLDDWESSGIDMDQDGVIAPELPGWQSRCSPPRTTWCSLGPCLSIYMATALLNRMRP